MRFARFLVAALLVLALASTAHANAIDAGVIIKQGNQSQNIGPHFTLTSPTGTTLGNGFVLLNCIPIPHQNNCGQSNGNLSVPFRNLKLIFNVSTPLPAGTPLGCSVLAFFSTCQFINPLGPVNTLGTPLSSANLVFLTRPFSGPLVVLYSGGHGIGLNGDFDIVINNWGSAPTITGAANVPEPATMSLVLLGAGAAFLRRKRMAA